jgi:hypothetical protein
MVTERVPAAALAVFLILGACGDDSSAGGSISTGLPPNETLSSLSDADAQKACTSIAESFNAIVTPTESKRISCVEASIQLSVTVDSQGNVKGDVDKCQSMVDTCVKSSGSGAADAGASIDTQLFDESSCNQAMVGAETKDCGATVGDYEACANALADELRTQLAGINCQGLSDVQKLETMSGASVDVESLPACKNFQTKCPSFSFDGSTDSSSSQSKK